ncbi:MAG: YggT family protein [Candidatus Eutrophobiaceae bacterium]
MISDDPVSNALVFLFRLFFDLLASLFLLRLLFQALRVNYHNALVRLVVQATNVLTAFYQQLIPDYRALNGPAAIALVAIVLADISLQYWLKSGIWIGVLGAAAFCLALIMKKILYLLFLALILRVIQSWMAPHVKTPFSEVLEQITDPLLNPLRKRLPSSGGIDWSPLAVFIIIQLLFLLLVNPLLNLASSLALSAPSITERFAAII